MVRFYSNWRKKDNKLKITLEKNDILLEIKGFVKKQFCVRKDSNYWGAPVGPCLDE